MSVYEIETEDGSVYEVETQDPYSGPKLASDPIGALTSADWWLTRPSGERISAGQAVAGPAASALQGLTLGAGDEIVAGLGSLLPGKTYDEELAKVRGVQRNFAEASPVADVALQIAGGLKTPMPSGLFSKAPGVKEAAKNVGKGALLGAGYGGTAGFLSGEGEDRVSGAGRGAATGAAVGGALQSLSEILAGFSNKAPAIAQAQNRKSIGTRQGDYSKSPQTVEVPIGEGEIEIASKVKTTLDDLLDNGYLGKSRKPQELMKNVAIREQELGSDISKLIHDADKKVIPDWAETIKFLESGRGGEKTDLFAEKLAKLDDLIQTKGKGKLSYLQQQKIAKGTEWNANDSLVNDFNRAVYADMQRAIEEAQPLVKPLNAELAKLKTVKPIIKRSLDAAENRDLGNKIIDFTKTTGGVGTQAIVGGVVGGVPGAALGLTTGAITKFATTPTGRRMTADALKALGPKAGKGAQIAEAILPNLAQTTARFGNTPKSSEQPNTRTEGGSSSKSAQEGAKDSTRTSPDSAAGSLFSQTESRLFGKAKRSLFGGKMKDKENTNLDALVRAVISQESGGRADAESDKGAIGMMQILPETAKEIAADLGVKEYDLKDPATNIKFGTHYLNKLLNRFNGDVELALTAYHSGQGRVGKLLSLTGGSKLSDILDLLGPVGQRYASDILGRMKGEA